MIAVSTVRCKLSTQRLLLLISYLISFFGFDFVFFVVVVDAVVLVIDITPVNQKPKLYNDVKYL